MSLIPLTVSYLNDLNEGKGDILAKALKQLWPKFSGKKEDIVFSKGGIGIEVPTDYDPADFDNVPLEWDEPLYFTLNQLKALGFEQGPKDPMKKLEKKKPGERKVFISGVQSSRRRRRKMS